MKIVWSDIPVNIFDAVDRYQRTSIAWAAFSSGCFLTAVSRGDWKIAGAAVALGAAGLVLAYFVGRES